MDMEIRAEMESTRRSLKDVEATFEKLANWKMMILERFERINKENADLVEQNLRLRESKAILQQEKEDLLKDNLRLKRETEAWRETTEELKKLEEAEKVKVLELQTRVEVEEGLRVRAEENLEAFEKSVKELELRTSMLDKCSNPPMNIAGLNSRGTRRTAFSRPSDIRISNFNVVDIKQELDVILPVSNGLNPAANMDGSCGDTPHTKDETESRELIAKQAASIKTTKANHVRHRSGSLTDHMPSDINHDSSLRFKRNRV